MVEVLNEGVKIILVGCGVGVGVQVCDGSLDLLLNQFFLDLGRFKVHSGLVLLSRDLVNPDVVLRNASGKGLGAFSETFVGLANNLPLLLKLIKERGESGIALRVLFCLTDAKLLKLRSGFSDELGGSTLLACFSHGISRSL